ncbi:MAG: tRNA lysidine(34) synthetase TilS [Gemmataceae bacterium]
MNRADDRCLVGAVRRAWEALGDPRPGLVVAVSGGPDSVALLRALVEVRPGPEVPLVVAHLNHRLRGEASEADARFVAELAEQLKAENVTLASACIDIAQVARDEGGNLEAVARRERYRWLGEVARAHGLGWIVTGHTANDQAETVLHRLLRGSGVAGLRGIAAQRELEPGVGVMRPLLTVSRAEVEAYLERLGQTACRDASNEDRRFTRNRLRHELLPLLAREYNPAIVEVLARLAQQAGEQADAVEAQTDTLLAEVELPRAGAVVVLQRERLGQAPRWLARALFHRLWQREGWPRSGMGHVEYERLVVMLTGGPTAQDLPGGVRAVRAERVLRIGPGAVV